MIISWDNYGIYRFSPETTLSAGLYFAHEQTNTGNEQRARVSITIASNPWPNLSYRLSAEGNYEIQKARWSVRMYPQVYYRWRSLFFSLTGTFEYFNENTGKSGWNYNAIFRVTRPFNVSF